MSANIPLANPIRFIKNNNEPDFDTKFPFVDNITQRENVTPGIYASKFYKDFIVGQPITFQLQVIGITDETIVVHQPDGTTTDLTPTDITPTGWTSAEVRSYTFTPTQAGVHYMVFTEPDLISDKFVAHELLKFKKQAKSLRNFYSDSIIVIWEESSK